MKFRVWGRVFVQKQQIPGILMESPDFCEIPGILVEFSNFFGEPQWVNNEVILCLGSSFRQFPYKNNKFPEF